MTIWDALLYSFLFFIGFFVLATLLAAATINLNGKRGEKKHGKKIR